MVTFLKGSQTNINLNQFNSSDSFWLFLMPDRFLQLSIHFSFSPSQTYSWNTLPVQGKFCWTGRSLEMPYWTVLLNSLHSFEAVSELIFLLTSVETSFRKFDNIPLALKRETALWTLAFVEALTCVIAFISNQYITICYQSILWPPPQFLREALSTGTVHCQQQREVQLQLPFPLPLLLTILHRIFLQASSSH